MKRTTYLMIPTMILLILLACNFSVSTANIKEAALAKDEQGAQPTTVFAPEDTFYCVVEMANAPDDTTIKTSWLAAKVEGYEENLLIDETELTGGSDTYFFNLDNGEQSWPAGEYQVDIYLNGELDRSLPFEVR